VSTYFKSGSYNCICQVCGFQFKAEDIKKRWDGLLVCKEDFELRHPMDFIRVPTESKPLLFTAPEPTETEVDVDYVADTVGTQDRSIPSGHNDGSL
jgi:hypothetical protein